MDPNWSEGTKSAARAFGEQPFQPGGPADRGEWHVAPPSVKNVSPSAPGGAAMQQSSVLVLGLVWHHLMFDRQKRGL
jgi:hypothetical protein